MKVSSILKNKNTIALALSLLIIAGTYTVITNFSPFYTEKAFGAAGGSGGNGPTSGGPTSGGDILDDNNNGNGGGAGVGDLCGWAWGATTETPSPKMGVGWISVNSKDCDTDGNGVMSSAEAAANVGCPAAGASVPVYKLTVDSNRYITGYAWSSNLGWLKFGGLTGAPTSAGDARISSNTQGNTTPVTGWARFCAGSANGTCSSTSRDDGWDGWLGLSGSWSNGMSYDANNNGHRTFQGYSWGGPVVGWIKWDQASGLGVRYCTDPVLSGSISASPSSGVAPMNTTLTASYQLSGSNQTPSYKFRCDSTGTWSSSRSGSNAHIYPRPGTGESGCSYSNGGRYYHPEVEITVGSQSVTPSTEIHVTNDNTGPNELGATCDVTPERVFINNSAIWTVELTQAGVPPYTYRFSFDDGQPNPTAIVTDETEVQVSRLQNTLGKKTLNVEVQDSTSPSPSHGQCTTNVQVIVNPTIIEI